MRRTRWPTALAVLAGVAPGAAAAHEVGASRFDAPIPLALLFLGAGVTVAVTAALLGGRETVPRLGGNTDKDSDRIPSDSSRIPSERNKIVSDGNPSADRGAATHETRGVAAGRPIGEIPANAVRWLRVAGRIGFGAVVAFAIVRGIAGRQVAAENFATVFVWPLWLKGIGLVALVVGSPWPALSPWRGVHALFERIEGEQISPFEYPERLGLWPAVVGFVAVVGIAENLTVIPGSPRFTAGLVAGYAALMILGGLAFGRTWFERADFFEVLYRQFGTVAPIRFRKREAVGTEMRKRDDAGAERGNRNDDGRHLAELRFPWTGCSVPAGATGGVAFVVAMVYTVTFDGFTSTPEYQRLLFGVRDALGTGALTGVGLYLVGLVAFVASFAAASALGDRISGRGLGKDAVSAARAFAPTVLPIAAAYELAHNFSFVVRNLSRVIELGARVAGVETTVALLGWLSVPVFWGVQVVLVVAGHVAAVVAAHEVAVRQYGSLPAARRGHAPLVAVMVGYTVLSLWIISRPVVAG